MNSPGSRPPAALAGLKVVDISTLLAAPQLGAWLADLGADVVKVEPPSGDPLERLGTIRNGRSAGYAMVNRGKRRVVVDPEHEDGRRALHELMAVADVAIANQPTALLRRWGCAPEALLESNPRLVFVSVSCFGATGPLADKGGNGSLAEAFAGLTNLTGDPDRPPVLPSVPLGDCLVGMAAAVGALAALWYRDANGGCGQHVDVAMYEPILTLLGTALSGWRPGVQPPSRTGSRVAGGAPRNVYECADGGYVVVSGTTDAQVHRVLALIGADSDDDVARFGAAAARAAHLDELDGLVASWIKARPLAEVLEALDARRVPAGAVHDLSGVWAHPHVVARGSLTQIDDEVAGSVVVPGLPARLAGTPGRASPFRSDPIEASHLLEEWRGGR